MKTYSDAEIAELATWAENEERQLAPDSEGKKGYGALRQGADWVLRFRATMRHRNIEDVGDAKVAQIQRKQ